MLFFTCFLVYNTFLPVSFREDNFEHFKNQIVAFIYCIIRDIARMENCAYTTRLQTLKRQFLVTVLYYHLYINTMYELTGLVNLAFEMLK